MIRGDWLRALTEASAVLLFKYCSTFLSTDPGTGFASISGAEPAPGLIGGDVNLSDVSVS